MIKQPEGRIVALLLFFLVLSLFSCWIPKVSALPNIQSVIQTPIEPPPNTVVNVVSFVVDRNGLVNVSLFYSTDNNTWTSRTMDIIDGDNYNGTFLAFIPGQSVGTCVSYCVYAVDSFGYSTQTAIQKYRVTIDTKKPSISGIGIVEPSLVPIVPTDLVKIHARIADNGTGIERVLLYQYGPTDDPMVKIGSFMELIDGDRYNGTYEGTLPHEVDIGNNTLVWYYIEAHDFAGNSIQSDYKNHKALYSDRSYLDIVVQIDEINTKDLSATLNIVFSAHLPKLHEQQFIELNAYNARLDNTTANTGFFRINLSTTKRFFYEDSATWEVDLLGTPNNYPYDSYHLSLSFQFQVGPMFYIITNNKTEPVFQQVVDDMKVSNVSYSDYRIGFVWENPKIRNPGANYTSGFHIIFADIQFARNADDRLPVTLPILALFFMLGATLFVDSKTELRSRLTVYLTSFVFIVGFFYTLGSWVPLRFGFTIAELLVITLTLGTVALVVSSFLTASLSKHHHSVLINTCTDAAAVLFIIILMLYVFKVQYTQALLLSFPILDSILVVVGVVYGLALRVALNLRRHLKKRTNNG